MTARPPGGGPISRLEGIERVAGPLAHELGQTVAVLAGVLDMLRDAGDADPRALELLDGEERRLRALGDELLAVAARHRT